MLFALGCAVIVPSRSSAQILVTKNAFVGANESNGLLTLYKGDPINNNGLTYYGESFLTVEVNGTYYTYNANVDTAANMPDVTLNFPETSKIKDTIRCIWKEQGFDIVQDAYPVAFTNSGVIVISVKIINHGISDLPAQAEYLMDNDNSSTTGATSGNDNPDIITNNGFITNTTGSPIWQESPPNPIPSFDLSFEYHPSAAKLGTVGIGYFDDTYTPSPLGLLPPALVQFGYWPVMVYSAWGPAAVASGFGDDATLIMGQANEASAFLPGVSDSVTEIFRTAYGIPEWCYDHGQIVGVAMYPDHITWNQSSLSYSPNPFQVQTYLFADDLGSAGNVTIRQTVDNPIHITSPKPTGATNNDTTQLQTIGTIGSSGVAIVNWTDSVIVSSLGCKGASPIDINFHVTANTVGNNTDSLVFVDNPWGCPIDVDCAHPDITPPKFRNSFVACDSILFDTLTAHDDTLYDLGLKNISYTSPDLASAQYSVTIDPPPPYNCTDTSATIFVQQIDTVHSGHVIFTFTDCADNISTDTVCFTAHIPVPDLTAPRFGIDSAVADCHAQCMELTVTDTNKSASSIDRGVDSIVIVSNTNMALSGVPNGGKYPANTPEATFHVCVMDSLLDGTIIIRANDTAHNFSYDTLNYCTTADTHPPVITATSFIPADSSFHLDVTDSQAWDRGVDSVWIESASNMTTIPASAPYSIPCKPTFTFRAVVIDTSQCASAMIFAEDCAGHVSGPTPLSFTKGAVPVITASRTTLCSTSDSAVLNAGTGFTGYLWSNGETTQKITVGQGNYFVTVQEGAGCPATSLTTTITFSPATPEITPAGPLTICSPGTENLDAGAGFATYQWLRDGAIMPDTTTEKIIVSSTGNYSVQVTNAAGCTGTSLEVVVTVNPLPPQPIITSANNILSSTPAVSYQWSLNGTSISGATNETYTPLSGGSYTVTITDANGCMSTSLPFSNAGSTLIGVSSMVFAQESNQVSIALSVLSSLAPPPGNLGFAAKIAFNRTLLVPAPGSFSSMSVSGDSLFVLYNGTGSASPGSLMSLPFTAALGDDSCTTVTIDSFAWSVPNIAVTTQSGNFCLTNLCYQGGPQLINPNGTVSLSEPMPNPSNNSIEIGYSLIEQGQTTLILYDLLGHEVLRLVDATMAPGTYTVAADVSRLPAGTYVYSLHTPTVVKSDHLEISR